MANTDNLLDSSTNGFHLSLGGNGVPTVASNPWGIGLDALTFSSGQMAAAAGANFNLATGDYTWEFRFKRDTGHLAVQQAILGRWGGGSGYQYLCYFDTDNKLKFLENGGTGLASAAITDGLAHAAAISKSSGNYSLYIDGTRVAGPVAGASNTIASSIPFMICDYDDVSSGANGGLPFIGTLGEIRLSNIARYTTASYTVATTPLNADANTTALLKLDSLHGIYLGAPTFLGNILLRTGYTQASGGWANPDGFLQDLSGNWYFSVSGYNGSIWTVWAFSAASPTALLSGSGVVTSSVALQTPGTGEGILAGNGTIIPWNGTYYHYYQSGGTTNNICVSSNVNLTSAFPQGTVLFAGFDPFVRVSEDGTKLEMFFARSGTIQRAVYYSSSTNGTTWTTPVLLTTCSLHAGDLAQGGYQANTGEPSQVFLPGKSISFLFHDGEPGATAGRVVCGYVSNDRTNWLPCKERYVGSGGSYIAAYDSSPWYDSANARLVLLSTNSTNTNSGQPTDSDIGSWSIPVNGVAPAGGLLLRRRRAAA